MTIIEHHNDGTVVRYQEYAPDFLSAFWKAAGYVMGASSAIGAMLILTAIRHAVGL